MVRASLNLSAWVPKSFIYYFRLSARENVKQWNTKITAEQNEVALSYHHKQYFLAVIFAAIIVEMLGHLEKSTY